MSRPLGINFSFAAAEQNESLENNKDSSNYVNELAAILVPIVFSLIFVVGVVGNALVITVLLQMRKRQANGLTITYCYILNLAVADIIFLLFCVPFQATVYSLPSWPFGEFVCNGSEFFQKTAMVASIYTMVALSFDRHSVIVGARSANQRRIGKGNAYLILLFVWIAASIFGTLFIFTRIQIVFGGIPFCVLNFEMPAYYQGLTVVIFVLGYVAPLLIISACYVGVLIAMARNARTAAASQNKSTQAIKKRVTKIAIMMVMFFMLDWFMHHMLILWIEFGDFPLTSGTLALQIVSHCLSYANSCVNPLIYAFVSNQFRKDFKSVCQCPKVSRAIVNVRRRSHNFNVVAQEKDQRHQSYENIALKNMG